MAARPMLLVVAVLLVTAHTTRHAVASQISQAAGAAATAAAAAPTSAGPLASAAAGTRTPAAKPQVPTNRGTELSHETLDSIASEWDLYNAALSRLSIDGSSLATVLALQLSLWAFSLPPSALQRGYVVSGGSSHRLRRVLHDLEEGRPVKLGVVGGSISWGSAVLKGKEDWFSMVTSYLSAAYPHANVTGRNGCVPATPSSFMNSCLENYMDEDVDLVFVEYVTNDADGGLKHRVSRMIYERLVRQLLAKPKAPAVVLVSLPVKGMAHPPPDSKRVLPWGSVAFPDTSEDVYTAHAQYYDLPALSLRTAVWRLAEFQEHGMSWSSFYGCCHDYVHLLAPGHKAVADLVVYMLQKVALGLAMQPWNWLDEAAVAARIPPPMYPGNEAGLNRLCAYGDDITAHVARTDGFQLVNEGTPDKPKWGMVADQPGAELEMEMNTTRIGRPGHPTMDVHIAFLRSYAGMGTANFSCTANCACKHNIVDAHHDAKISMIFLVRLQPSQHPRCRIRATILGRSTRGGHKFKIAGLMANEYVGDMVVGHVMHETNFDQLLDNSQPSIIGSRPGFGASPHHGWLPGNFSGQPLHVLLVMLALPCMGISATLSLACMYARRARQRQQLRLASTHAAEVVDDGAGGSCCAVWLQPRNGAEAPAAFSAACTKPSRALQDCGRPRMAGPSGTQPWKYVENLFGTAGKKQAVL